LFDSVKETEVLSYRVKSQCKGVLEENPCKSSKSDQTTRDQSYYEGNIKSKEPTMMIQFARISHLFYKLKKVKQLWHEMLMEDVRLKFVEATNAMVMMDIILGYQK
jgi:hypothetical protein